MLECYQSECYIRMVALKLMGFPIRVVWFCLLIVPHVLFIPVAVTMFRKGLHRDFPVFFTYVLCQILEFGVLFAMYVLKVPRPTSQIVDHLCREADVTLHFGMIQELFESPFADIIPMRRAMGRTFTALAIVLAGLVVLSIAPLLSRIPGYGVLRNYEIIESLNVAQCALLICVFVWHRFLGFRMSLNAFGIALGLGLVVFSEPLSYALKTVASTRNSIFVDLAQMAVFQVSVLLWIYYVRARESVDTNIDAAYLLNARDWASGIERITRP